MQSFNIIIIYLLIVTALDAYCLLEIYNVLAECSLHMDIPFQDICSEIQHIPQKFQKTNPNKSTYKVQITKSYINIC